MFANLFATTETKEKKMSTRKGMALAALLFASAVAHGQTAGTITFAVEVTSASNGTVTPKATWSTTPAAVDCTASDGWTGAKAASGTETLAPVTASKNYVLTCRWGNDTATVSWTAPTQYTDGSAFTPAGYRVYHRQGSATAAPQKKSVTGTSTTLGPLATAKWYISVTALDAGGSESLESNQVTFDSNSATASKSVALAVRIPSPPTNLTAQ